LKKMVMLGIGKKSSTASKWVHNAHPIIYYPSTRLSNPSNFYIFIRFPSHKYCMCKKGGTTHISIKSISVVTRKSSSYEIDCDSLKYSD
jgi:hypothetical protein